MHKVKASRETTKFYAVFVGEPICKAGSYGSSSSRWGQGNYERRTNMKISIPNRPEAPFNTLDCGEVFMHDSKWYIKMDCDLLPNGAVDLIKGVTTSFGDLVMVTPYKDAELVLKP